MYFFEYNKKQDVKYSRNIRNRNKSILHLVFYFTHKKFIVSGYYCLLLISASSAFS